MPAKKYFTGERIGPHQCLFVEEITESKVRKGKFLCGKCNEKYFISKVSAVACGNTWMCLSCSNQKNRVRKNASEYNLQGKKIGKLTVLHPVKKRNKNGNIIWKCQCDCGNYVEVESFNLRSRHTISCGVCQKSKGEQKIQNILSENNIRFFHEHIFQDCINPKTGAKLRFDFYLPDHNCCIEYDGRQHYTKEGTWYENKQRDFNDCIRRDKIKDQYCEKNKIFLVRIPYLDYNNINEKYIEEKLREAGCNV